MENKFNIGEYIIVNNRYSSSSPFKIKITEITKCTIMFDNLDAGTTNIRMFIEQMNKDYNIVEYIT